MSASPAKGINSAWYRSDARRSRELQEYVLTCATGPLESTLFTVRLRDPPRHAAHPAGILETASRTRSASWNRQNSFASHAAPFVRHASIAAGRGFAIRPSDAGTCGHCHDTNLYACGCLTVEKSPHCVFSTQQVSCVSHDRARSPSSTETILSSSRFCVDSSFMELIASQKSAENQKNRADSSIGRALPLQGRGHRFDPCSAYQ